MGAGDNGTRRRAIISDEFLIDAIYEAATIPDLWPQVLEQVAEAAGAFGAVVLATDGQVLNWRSSPAFRVQTDEYLAGGFSRTDQRTARLISANKCRFLTDLDVFTPEEWTLDPIRSEFWVPRGFGWGVATYIAPPTGGTIIFHAERRLIHGPAEEATIARLDRLRPHLARAAFLSSRIAFENLRTSVETLTAVGLAAAALDSSANVILANRAFSDAAHIWTTRSGDKIALQDRAADAMLSNLLTRVEQNTGPWSVPVRDTRGGLAAVIQVIPVRRSARDLFGRTSVIAVLCEGKNVSSSAAIIQSVFDLTPAEVTVAQALASGLSAHEIAQATHRSVITVRNQIKSAMNKTGCSRQVELVLLVRRFVVIG